MKNSLFTIVFMVIITVLFISTLAFINESSKDRIARNKELENYKSILYAFNIFPENVSENEFAPTSTTNDIPWDENQILEKMKNQIKMIKLPISESQRNLLTNSFLSWKDSVEIYIQLNENKEVLSYGFPLKGKGLWGTVTAFGVVSSDLSKMVGIDFIQQVETPGLGARIIETEFKYFFRNLNLSKFHDPIIDEPYVIMVTKKEKTNLEESTNSLQAITGATLTCNGILKMLNTDLLFYIALIKGNEQVIKNKR